MLRRVTTVEDGGEAAIDYLATGRHLLRPSYPQDVHFPPVSRAFSAVMPHGFRQCRKP